MMLKTGRGGNKGYTMAEMMTVIAVIFIILAIMTLSTSGLVKNTNLKTTTNNIVSMLELTRHYALANGKNYYLVLNGTSKKYYIATDSTPNSGAVDVIEGKTQSVPAGIVYDSITFPSIGPGPEPTVTFNKSGSLDASGEIILGVELDGEIVQIKKITIDVLTGKAYVSNKDE